MQSFWFPTQIKHTSVDKLRSDFGNLRVQQGFGGREEFPYKTKNRQSECPGRDSSRSPCLFAVTRKGADKPKILHELVLCSGAPRSSSSLREPWRRNSPANARANPATSKTTLHNSKNHAGQITSRKIPSDCIAHTRPTCHPRRNRTLRQIAFLTSCFICSHNVPDPVYFIRRAGTLVRQGCVHIRHPIADGFANRRRHFSRDRLDECLLRVNFHSVCFPG